MIRKDALLPSARVVPLNLLCVNVRFLIDGNARNDSCRLLPFIIFESNARITNLLRFGDPEKCKFVRLRTQHLF